MREGRRNPVRRSKAFRYPPSDAPQPVRVDRICEEPVNACRRPQQKPEGAEARRSGACGNPLAPSGPTGASAHPPAWHTSAHQASANGSKVSVQLGCRLFLSGWGQGVAVALPSPLARGQDGAEPPRQCAQPGCGEGERERRRSRSFPSHQDHPRRVGQAIGRKPDDLRDLRDSPDA